MSGKVIIWGSKNQNRCQEQDLKLSLNNRGIDSEIRNKVKFGDLSALDEKEDNLVLIRNFFYNSIKDYTNYEQSDVVKKLRQLESKSTILNSIEGLVLARDKLKINELFKKLKVPHIKAYKLENSANSLVDWINSTVDSFSNGVIIKDRFGGLGNGIVRVKKQGSLYLCDLSCVVEKEQKYINDTLTSSELKNIFKTYMKDYDLIGQPYICSSHEFKTLKESESIRVLDIGGTYLAMKRVAESPINNMNLTKHKVVNGEVQRTKATEQERESSKKISDAMNLFFVGHDFIRTKMSYYQRDIGAIYIPQEMKKQDNISLLLEVNGLVQYAGIQELYKNQLNVSEYLVSAIQDRLRK